MAGLNWLRLSVLAATWLGIVISVAPAISDQAEARLVFGYIEETRSAQTQYDESLRAEAMRVIAQQYGITLADRTAHWTLAEVLSVRRALTRLENRVAQLADRDAGRAFRVAFESVAFYRDRAYQGNFAYAIGGTISFYDAWAQLGDDGRAFYLAHELGHLWDARTSALHLTLGEISSGFAANVGAFVDEHGRYQLGPNFPGWATGRTLRHRDDSAAEDWAESLATVLVPEFETSERHIGRVRYTEVQRLMREWAQATKAQAGRPARGME